MQKVTILDFDGVIVDSIKECFIISYWAYQGKSTIGQYELSLDNAKVREQFLKYRYLVGPASEYYFLMRSIYNILQNPKESIKISYSKYKIKLQKESKKFSKNFFALRKYIQNKFFKTWLDLNPVYEGIPEIIKLIRSKSKFFIASTKDETSIQYVLINNDIYVPNKAIYGNNFSCNKEQQIREIIEKTNANIKDYFFIDDNIEYLSRIKDFGINCYLASWGYNNAEIRAKAIDLGIDVFSIEDIEKMIYTI